MKNAATALLAGLAGFNFTRDITVAYVGVPLNVLVACAIGAFCSFSFGDKVEPRKKMWGLFVVCLFMGGAFTSITNALVSLFTDLEMTDSLQAGLGTVVSFSTRFFLPWLVDVLKEGKWLSWIPFARNRSNDQ